MVLTFSSIISFYGPRGVEEASGWPLGDERASLVAAGSRDLMPKETQKVLEWS